MTDPQDPPPYRAGQERDDSYGAVLDKYLLTLPEYEPKEKPWLRKVLDDAKESYNQWPAWAKKGQNENDN